MLRQRFDDVLKSIAPWTTELEKARGAAAAIGAAISGATSDAATFIKQFEGFTAVAKQDTDGKFRVGYGSDTTTDASGQSHPVTATTTTTEEDAERDLARRIVEAQAEAAKAIGPIWESLSAQVKVSITDLFYNYGNNIQRLSGVIAAAKTGDTNALGSAIGSLGADNGGINARRRASEALNLTGAPAAVTDPARVAAGTEAYNEQLDKINQINAAKSGGTEIEKAQTANLQATLAGRQDEIAATERLIEATQRQLANAHSIAEQTKLQAELDRERVTLKGQQNAAEEAQLHLAIGQAQGTGDAKGQHDAAVALAEFKMGLYGQDTAEYKRALDEKEAADRQYAATQKQVAMELAQEAVRSAESEAAAKIKQYDTDYRAHATSEQKKLGDTRQALDDEILQQEVALAAEANLDNLRPQERQKVLAQMLQLEQDYSQKVAQLQTQAAADAAKSWESLGSTIDGAINSQLKSVLSHAEIFPNCDGENCGRSRAQVCREGRTDRHQLDCRSGGDEDCDRSRQPWFKRHVIYRRGVTGDRRGRGTDCGGRLWFPGACLGPGGSPGRHRGGDGDFRRGQRHRHDGYRRLGYPEQPACHGPQERTRHAGRSRRGVSQYAQPRRPGSR